ncbi:unnamed protein product [Prunus brigantina]
MALKSPDGSIFGENVLILKMGLHMQSALCNYILTMEATTIGILDRGHNTKIIVTSTVLSTGLLILGLTLLLYVRKNQQQIYGELKPGQKEDLELPLFDLAAVVCATKNFSNNNKLGEANFVFRVNFFNFGLQTFSQSQCSKNGARRLGRPPRRVGSFSGAEQGGRSSRNLTASASSVLCECKLSCLLQMSSNSIAVRLYP